MASHGFRDGVAVANPSAEAALAFLDDAVMSPDGQLDRLPVAPRAHSVIDICHLPSASTSAIVSHIRVARSVFG